MIVGIGCDIVNIKRIDNILNKFGSKFLTKIFTEREISIGKIANNTAYFAKRFSSKEAYAKASSYGIGKKVNFKDVEILNDSNGAPYFSEYPLKFNRVRAFLSISDELPYAMSYVILEKIGVTQEG